MELVRWEAGRLGDAAHGLDPVLGAADVHVALGQVGHPPGEGGHVVGRVDAGPEPGVGCPPVAGKPQDLQPPFDGELVELALEQRPVGEPVQQDGVARRVLQPLGQRPQLGAVVTELLDGDAQAAPIRLPPTASRGCRGSSPGGAGTAR